jgi:hypothetical protein
VRLIYADTQVFKEGGGGYPGCANSKHVIGFNGQPLTPYLRWRYFNRGKKTLLQETVRLFEALEKFKSIKRLKFHY